MNYLNPVNIVNQVGELYTNVGVNSDVTDVLQAFHKAIQTSAPLNTAILSGNTHASTAGGSLIEPKTDQARLKSAQLRSTASYFNGGLSKIVNNGEKLDRVRAENMILGAIQANVLPADLIQKSDEIYGELHDARKAALFEHLGEDTLRDVLSANSAETIINAKNISDDRDRFEALANIDERILGELANNSQSNANTKNLFERIDGIYFTGANDRFEEEGVYKDNNLYKYVKDVGNEAKDYLDTISAKIQDLSADDLKRFEAIGAANRNNYINSGAIYTTRTQNDTFSQFNPNLNSSGFIPGSSMANYANGLQASARREVNGIYSNPSLRNQYSIYGEAALDPYSNLNNPLVSSNNIFNNNPYETNSYDIYGNNIDELNSDYRRGWS